MELVSKAADSIAEGDIVERSKQNLIVCYGSGYNILLILFRILPTLLSLYTKNQFLEEEKIKPL